MAFATEVLTPTLPLISNSDSSLNSSAPGSSLADEDIERMALAHCLWHSLPESQLKPRVLR